MHEENVKTSERVADDSNVKEQRENPHLENYERYMPVEPKPQNGFYHNWGHMAVINYFLGKAAIKRLYPTVSHTMMPILKLCSENKEDVKAAYNKIKELHEKSGFFESPREKYRKIYGNYVREIEWACTELRKYFTKRAYEDLVIDSTLLYIKEVLGKYIDKMNEMMVRGKTIESMNKEPDKKELFFNRLMIKILNFNFKYIFNVAGWLIGDVEVPEFNVRTNETVMKVTDCLMLRAPRMRQLPEEACILA